ncbi:hypothetical protein, partial [Escherichia coli]|uniref:hypothetical protein n=1 Tax=Escherichia coli TaxID=562 RepID=UPI0034D98253
MYSIRIIYFVTITKPRFPPLISINVYEPDHINPNERRAFGGIFEGGERENKSPPSGIPVLAAPGCRR